MAFCSERDSVLALYGEAQPDLHTSAHGITAEQNHADPLVKAITVVFKIYAGLYHLHRGLYRVCGCGCGCAAE